MAVGSPSTAQRRLLGRELRRLRESAGIRADQLAVQLRCSASRISRIEMARVRIAPGTVHEILDALEVHGPERGRLVGMAREADQPGWWQEFADELPPEYVTFIALESEASVLHVVEPIVVHGLLQTEAYARAIIEQGAKVRTPSAIEARLRARLSRQTMLIERGRPALRVVMDEAALHHVFGDRTVLVEQLRYLVELARLPHITLQILPFEHAGHIGLFPGPTVVMEFPDAGSGRVMYLENLAGGAYVERQDVIEDNLSLLRGLRQAALNPRETLAMLQSRIAAMTTT